MKTVEIPLWILVAAAVVFVLAARALWIEVKEGLKYHPNDDLSDLEFKITYSLLDERSELYLINRIKELKNRPEVNQQRLNELDTMFRQRYQELHLTDEHELSDEELEKRARRIMLRHIAKEKAENTDVDFLN